MEFIKYNANPKNKKTGDCVVRAVCTALNEDWVDTYKGMLDVAIRTGYAISSKDNYQRYLLEKGYDMQKQPRKPNNKKYTVEEFANEIAKSNTTYILNIANHVTVIINNNLYDLWNCRYKTVGNYWMLKTIKIPEV